MRPLILLPGVALAICACTPAAAGPKRAATHITMDYPSRELPLRTIRIERNGKKRNLDGKTTTFEVGPGNLLLSLENVNTILYDVEIQGAISRRFTLDAFLDLTKPAKKTTGPQQALGTTFLDAVKAYRSSAERFRSEGTIGHQRLSLVAVDAETVPFKPASSGGFESLKSYMQQQSKAVLVDTNPDGLFTEEELKDLSQVGRQRFSIAATAFGTAIERYATDPAARNNPYATQLKDDVTREFAALSAESVSLFARYDELRKLYDLMQKSPFTYEDNQVLDADSGDTVKYTVKLTPRANKVITGGAEIPTHTRELVVNAAGGWEIDAAPGFFLAFGDLRDRSYGKRTRNGVTRVVRRGGEDAFKPSAGAMVHIHRRLSGEVHWGPSFGLSVQDGKTVQYLGGLSLLFGEKKRVVVTGGVAGGLVSRLDGLEEGDAFSGDKIPVKDRFGIGPFLGLTYNF